MILVTKTTVLQGGQISTYTVLHQINFIVSGLQSFFVCCTKVNAQNRLTHLNLNCVLGEKGCHAR